MYSYYNLKNSAGPIKRYNKLIEYADFIENKNCICNPVIEKSQSANPNGAFNSRNIRISNTINTPRGGRFQLVNPNGTPLNLNYLGRLEGSPEGGGLKIKNKF